MSNPKRFQPICLIKLDARRTHPKVAGRYVTIPKPSPIPLPEKPTTLRQEKAQRMLMKQNNRCYWCCIPTHFSECHIDHIIPRSAGGSDAHCNLRATCKKCNKIKHTMSPVNFALYQLGANNTLQYRLIPHLGGHKIKNIKI